MGFDPNRLAIGYYFGELQYWKLPKIAADALENGFDGPALRRLAGLINPVRTEMQDDDVDSAFREMGVTAPIAKEKAQLALAAESAQKVVDGQANPLETASHIRIYLCDLSGPPDALKQIVLLSQEARNASRHQRKRIEADLVGAFTEFLKHQGTQTPG